MPIRVSYFFQQRPNLLAGWSTNFWSNASSFTALDVIATSLESSIERLQGFECAGVARRYSSYPFSRSVQVEFRGRATNFFAQDLTGEADFPTTALLLRVYAIPDYSASLWIRGINETLATMGGVYTPSSEYVKRINELTAKLANPANQWAIRALDKAVPARVVVNLTSAGVATVPGHGYGADDRVRISRARGLTQANRIWRVTPLDSDNFQLQGWQIPVPAPIYLGGGMARKQVYIFPQITAAKVLRTTRHNVGRPFGLFTGRHQRRA